VGAGASRPFGWFHWYALLSRGRTGDSTNPRRGGPGVGQSSPVVRRRRDVVNPSPPLGPGAGCQGDPGMACSSSASPPLLGPGAYRPFEARRMRRRLAGLAAWRRCFSPLAAGFCRLASGGQPRPARRCPPPRWEVVPRRPPSGGADGARREGQDGGPPPAPGPLTEAHKARWERNIQQIPNLPLTGGEWGDLGIPRGRPLTSFGVKLVPRQLDPFFFLW
jgi:hypothetical protein